MGMTRMFRRTDTGAPRLSGTAGDVVALLDALLVDGYNSVTLTSITRSGSTATATLTSHGFVKDRLVRIAGCDQTEYNGDFWITSTTSSTFTFEVSGTPASPATTGTSITAKVAPCDWTKTYSGTNKASYTQGAGSNGFVLGIDDTDAQLMRLRGFESMTAAGVNVADGSGPFPTDGQISGGCYLFKSNAASTAAREWVAFGDEKRIYLFTNSSSTSTGELKRGFRFGDFNSYTAGDVYNTYLVASEADDSGWSSGFYVLVSARASGSFLTNPNGSRWAARSYSQTGGSVRVNDVVSIAANSDATGSVHIGYYSNSAATYPAPAAGGMLLTPIYVQESIASGNRGVVPGMWAPIHVRPRGDFDTFSGAAGTELEGKRFIQVNTYDYGGGCFMFEIGGSW